MRPTQWRRSTHALIGVAVLLIVAAVVAAAAFVTSGNPSTSAAAAVAPQPAAVTAHAGSSPLADDRAEADAGPAGRGARAVRRRSEPGRAHRPRHRRDHRRAAVGAGRRRADAARVDQQGAHHRRGAAHARPRRDADHDGRAADQTTSPGWWCSKGGGDPTLSAAPPGKPTWYRDAARISDLADQVREAGIAVTSVQVDVSAYSGPTMAPGWDPLDIHNGDIAPMESVMLDGGRTQPVSVDSWRSEHPGARRRAARWPSALRRRPGDRHRAAAPAGQRHADRRGAVAAADRAAAADDERLRQRDGRVDRPRGRRGARRARELRRGGARRFSASSRSAGVDTRGATLFDSSGLSVNDRLTALTLDDVVNAAAGDDEPDAAPAGRPAADRRRQRHAVQPLPRHRRGQGRAAGFLRAKTGSLTGTNALAGIVTDASGRVLTFALISNNAGPTGRTSIDALAADVAILRMQPRERRLDARHVGRTVDWEFAATVGAQADPARPACHRVHPPPGHRASSRSPSRKAELPVREVTGLNEGAAVTEARIVDRAEWVRAATESMRVMTGGDGDGEARADSSPAASPARRPARCWRSSRRASSGSTTRSRRERWRAAAGVPERHRRRAPTAGHRQPISGCGCACTRSPTACSSAPIRGWPTTCRARWR